MKKAVVNILQLLAIILLFDDSFNFTVAFYNISIVDPFFLLFCSSFFMYFFLSNDRILLDKTKRINLLFIYGFIVVVTLHIPIGSNTNENIRLSFGLLEGLLLAVFVILLINNEIELDKIGRTFLVTSVLASVVSLAVGFNVFDWPFVNKTPPSRQILSLILPWTRNAGLFSNYSAYNTTLIIGLSYALIKYRLGNGYQKILFLSLVFILLIGFLMPQSRAGFLAAAFVVATYFLWARNKVLVVVPVVASLAIIFFITFDEVISLVIALGEPSARTRIGQYSAVMMILPDIVFFGEGLGTFMSDYEYSMHNIFMNVLVAFGFGGALLFICLVFAPYTELFLRTKHRASNSVYVRLCWIPLALTGQLVVLCFASGLSLMAFWIMVGCMVSIVSVQKTRLSTAPSAIHQS